MRQKRLNHFSSSHPDEATVNLTPLIDVVFVVLIMFILIAPMLEIDKIQLAAGSSKGASESVSASGLSIHVEKDNTILINKRTVDPAHLKPLLVALHAKDPRLKPQLYHDKQAFFGTYQLVKNALEDAGFEELDIVLKNETH